jgi:CRP/FNR family cyclic AMP-dependent transcriptional regulator
VKGVIMVTLTQPDRNALIVELLKSSPNFTGLEPYTLKKIGRLMVEWMVAKDEIIWLEQDRAKKIYIVASGLIKLFKMSAEGKEQILRLARPGDCFGHTGIFNGGSNPESAQALAPTVLYGIMHSDLEALLWQQPQLALNVIKALATEMHHYISLIEDLSLRRVSGRVARMLLQYSSEESFDNSLIRTQGDMAAMTGSVREVVGKSLRTLEEKGLIRSNSRHIIIRDSEALKTIAG